MSAALKQKNIQPSELRFGVLGLGVMGSGIVKNLLNSGHKVHVWNRSSDKVSPGSIDEAIPGSTGDVSSDSTD